MLLKQGNTFVLHPGAFVVSGPFFQLESIGGILHRPHDGGSWG